MKKYIYAERKEDILKAQAEWQERYNARKAEYDAQIVQYESARADWQNQVDAAIREEFKEYISNLKLGTVSITVKRGELISNTSVEITYSSNTCALDWSYKIRLNIEGKIFKDSSAWTGLRATTPEEADDLLASAQFIRAIVNFDWGSLLQKINDEAPRYKNIVTINNPECDITEGLTLTLVAFKVPPPVTMIPPELFKLVSILLSLIFIIPLS